eukprot:CAMPEP_0113304206 /NCGR_PEP_ID=MMETSP0010_2-20120614/4322_1 /TAXON_ID=216773 ORGANISM="Corethron hystrix, Strain 308" /NCGR_SAMPLE_ID=MMETSP0010_2 /ASSEMBLY_ACC=CAM_ASM_000155 /LENGTH=82 /DNA_ID=CAMNT_0000158371 /DNA_START=398 /DNA_END=646 /DNA_ORIENTATION=- /assembly_acc=CAM_ASM_000155
MAMVEQTPWPLHSRGVPGHIIYSHAAPVNPSAQEHVPAEVSQMPMSEHSAGACASSSSAGAENQDFPCGHVIREQSAPDLPV